MLAWVFSRMPAPSETDPSAVLLVSAAQAVSCQCLSPASYQ